MIDPFSPLAHIGDTPLVELRGFSPRPAVRIFAKLEGQNPSGSIKDRVANRLVTAAERDGRLRPGMTIVEASSGNTAIALALIARRKGYGLRVVLPEGVPASICDVLELYGVEIERCPPKAGMKGAIDRAEEIAARAGCFPLRQFYDSRNVETHYGTTGAEILEQLPSVDVFVAGIGTGGTITGVGRRLREHNPDLTLVGVEPKMGEHLQGLASFEEAFVVPLVDLDLLDRRFMLDASRSIALAREITRREGLLVGVSSGAVLHAALRVAEPLEAAHVVVMFSDGGWKYLPARPWDAAQRGEEMLDEMHWW